MMLPEPERTIVLVWLAAGNAPKRVPFGVSGHVWSFAVLARKSGMFGAFKRFGGRHIERSALAYIASGDLSVARARVGVVWELLRAKGPLVQCEIKRTLVLDHNAVRKTVDELVQMGSAVRIAEGRGFKVHACGEVAPHWSDFLRGSERAA